MAVSRPNELRQADASPKSETAHTTRTPSAPRARRGRRAVRAMASPSRDLLILLVEQRRRRLQKHQIARLELHVGVGDEFGEVVLLGDGDALLQKLADLVAAPWERQLSAGLGTSRRLEPLSV